MFITFLKKIIVFAASYFYPGYFFLLRKSFSGCNFVLEIGCGESTPLKYFSHKFYAVGLDIHRASIKKAKKAKIHNDYICSDFLEADIKPKSFDCVVALDLIEHLGKKEGLKLIKKARAIARKKVIIFTPNGFLEQEEFEQNPGQAHKSGWKVEEMEQLGFKVWGVRGFKGLRGRRAHIRYRPKLFWRLISSLTQLFVYFQPKYAFQIFCVDLINKVAQRENL